MADNKQSTFPKNLDLDPSSPCESEKVTVTIPENESKTLKALTKSTLVSFNRHKLNKKTKIELVLHNTAELVTDVFASPLL